MARPPIPIPKPQRVPTMPFQPDDWYWMVAGSTTQVFSSAANNFVPISDPAYLTWLSSHPRGPSPIASEAELGGVLANHELRPTAANVLDGFKDSLAVKVVATPEFKIIFNHENRIRAIERALSLNGSPADMTPNQARNVIKQLM